MYWLSLIKGKLIIIFIYFLLSKNKNLDFSIKIQKFECLYFNSLILLIILNFQVTDKQVLTYDFK